MNLQIGLYTGLSAIRAAQAGIDTAGHNIANSATPGYTRQRVELAAKEPYSTPRATVGTGVDITTIHRLRNHFADARVRSTTAEFARLDVRAELLKKTEAVTGEPDAGISKELTALWDSFEDLAMDPSDPAVRRQVLTQLDTLAGRVRSVAGAWDQLARDTTVRRDSAIDEVNNLLAEVAEINRQLADDDPLLVSSDLLDRRDRALDRLAELTGATVDRKADNTVDVTVGGQKLVDKFTTNPVSVVGADIVSGGTPITSSTSGELAGLHEFVTTTMPARKAALDTFVGDLVQTLNTQHAAGYTPSGASGGPLLSMGADATTLAVAVTNPADLAAGGSLGAGGTPGSLDGTNAQKLADLRAPAGGGTSLNQQFNSLVVDLGASVSGARKAADAAGDIAVGAEMARSSEHGVSLDEEMVDIVRFQRQLEAASRVMTAVDEMLNTVINRVGLVGR